MYQFIFFFLLFGSSSIPFCPVLSQKLKFAIKFGQKQSDIHLRCCSLKIDLLFQTEKLSFIKTANDIPLASPCSKLLYQTNKFSHYSLLSLDPDDGGDGDVDDYDRDTIIGDRYVLVIRKVMNWF